MRSFAALLIFMSTMACKGKPAVTKAEKKSDSVNFFQVTEFLQGQVNEVNKTPFFIYCLNITDGKKDSTPINSKVFTELAAPFLHPSINDPAIKQNYTENVFFDQTTKSYTISYATTNKELEVQNVDILLNEDAKTVKRIFIRKFYNYADSSATEQLSWKPDQSFQIIRMVELPGQNETSKQTVVVWNDKG